MATLTATPATFDATMAKVAGGDIVQLAAGNYGAGYVKNITPASEVLIQPQDAANPPVFRTLSVITCKNLTFSGLSVIFTPDANTYAWTPAVKFDSATDCAFSAGRVIGGPAVNGIDATATALDKFQNIKGQPCGYGVQINGGARVRLIGSTVQQFDRGVYFSLPCDDALVDGNTIDGMRRTAILGAPGNRVRISRNKAGNSKPWRWGQTPLGDHGDFLRFWALKGQVSAFDGVQIVQNEFYQDDGLTLLGVCFEGGTVSGTAAYTNIAVEDNLIRGACGPQGIVTAGVKGGSVRRNKLLSVSKDPKQVPGILLSGSGVTCEVNVAASVTDQTKQNTIGANELFLGLATDYLAKTQTQPPFTPDPRDVQIADLKTRLAASDALAADLTTKLNAMTADRDAQLARIKIMAEALVNIQSRAIAALAA